MTTDKTVRETTMLQARSGLQARWARHGLATLLAAVLTLGLARAAVPGQPIPAADLARQAVLFEEPLVPSKATIPQEDADLLAAISRYRTAPAVDDTSALDAFLRGHSDSGWRVALLTNLGLSYYHDGYFSKSLAAFEQAWLEGRYVDTSAARAIVDRAAGELVRLHMSLGHAEILAGLIPQLEARHVSGRSTELLDGARDALWRMQRDPASANQCGPAAVKNLLADQGISWDQSNFPRGTKTASAGASLLDLSVMAARAGLAARVIVRPRGTPVPIPSVVHWRTGHFSTILARKGNRYELSNRDTDGGHLWVVEGALDSEASGFFLVPASVKGVAWQDVDPAKAAEIRGAGYETSSSNPNDTKATDQTTGGDGNGCGMCGYAFTEMLVSLRISDTPVGYVPPRGPPVKVTLTYNQREASQPATFGFFNISPKWSLNWLSYIQDDPVGLGTRVTRLAAGGGSDSYSGYSTSTNAFTPEVATGAVLTVQNPAFNTASRVYQRLLPDGTVETYAASTGAKSFPRLTFLSSITDPSGNRVTLNYDSQFRLTSVVDGTGRVTRFAYGLPSSPFLAHLIHRHAPAEVR
jgi:YD repeat-containing protein